MEEEKQRKASYGVRNWAEYDRGLITRGSITVWVTEDAKASWMYQGEREAGGKKIYSDSPIQLMWVLKEVYRLTNRKSKGSGVCEVDIGLDKMGFTGTQSYTN